MKEFKDIYFLYVGNAYPHKNLERAIKAVVHLNKKTNTKILLYVVSARNVFIERLEKFIEKHKAKEYVKLMGYVEDEKLKKLYENSVAFLYPSLMEGFGLPGLEALKAGTILLASDIPVFKEIYGHTAIYFDPLDVNSIENSLKKALSFSKVEAEKIIRENRAFVKRYSWEEMAKETLAIYQNP